MINEKDSVGVYIYGSKNKEGRKMTEVIYKLWRDGTFIFSGSKEIIKLYLRLSLDKWEDMFIGDKRKQLMPYPYLDEEVDRMRILIRDARSRAFIMWQRDMEEEHYRIEWEEDGKHCKNEDVVMFFLEDM